MYYSYRYSLLFFFSMVAAQSDFLLDTVLRLPQHRNFFQEEQYLPDTESKYIVVGLGANCHPAWFTRQYKIRSYAFPFDWCLTHYNALYRVLERDFKDCFKPQNFVSSRPQYFTPDLRNFFVTMNYVGVSECESWVLDKESGIIYVHDFSDNNTKTIAREYEGVCQKYERRVERFLNLKNSNKHIYFIRYGDITRSQSEALITLLKQKFSPASCSLIAVGFTQDFAMPWHLTDVENYYFSGDSHEEFWEMLCNRIHTAS